MAVANEQGVPSEITTRLLRAAAQAPSGHNTQPWRFAVEGQQLTILADLSRRLPAVDPDDHALFISLGCALENLLVAARGEGYDAEVDHTGLDGEDPAIAVHLRAGGAGDSHATGLYAAIPERQSTRRPYDGRVIPSADLRRLEGASRQEGVGFHLFTDPGRIEHLVELVEEGNRRQFRDPAFVEELITWIRFNPSEVQNRQDGLTHAAMGLPSIPRWLGRFVMRRLTTPGSQARSAAGAPTPQGQPKIVDEAVPARPRARSSGSLQKCRAPALEIRTSQLA